MGSRKPGAKSEHTDPAEGDETRDAGGRNAVDRGKLESAILGHVVERLKSSHAGRNVQADVPVSDDSALRALFGGIGPRDVLIALLDPKPAAYNRILDEMLERKNRLKHLCSYIISPVADELGRMWKDDLASFTQITLASGRMSVMVHQISQSRRPETLGSRQRSILLGRMPGADHTLGLAVVSACFREAGWDVEGGADLFIDDKIIQRVAGRRHTVFGISVGRTDEIEDVGSCIRTVAKEMANNRPLFGIGGAAVSENIVLFSHLNADFVASDAWEAVSMAEAAIE